MKDKTELTKIPKEALEMTVQGVNLREGSLNDQIHQREHLLVFLRHLG